MSNIFKTKDYEMFKKHPNNRDIFQRNLKKIITSIQNKNLMEFKPILVDKEMRVIDGQHRLVACKFLNIDIFYQIAEEGTEKDIISICEAQGIWRTEDYVSHYSSLGNMNYIKLKQYALEKELPLPEITKYFIKQSKKETDEIKNGTFIFPNEQEIKLIDELLNKYRIVVKIIRKYMLDSLNLEKSRNLRYAILSLLRNPNFNFDLFLNKISLKAEMLRMCTTSSAFYALLRDIYNYRNHNRIE